MAAYFDNRNEKASDISILEIGSHCAKRNDASMYAQWIKRELERTGRSQVELAPAMGLDAVKLSKSLRGTRRLQPAEIEGAARFFGVPVPSNALGRPLVASYDPDVPDEDPTESEAVSGGDGDPIDVRATWPAEAIPELLAHGGMGEGHVIQIIHAGEMRTIDEVKNDYWRIPSDFARSALGAMPLHLLVVECEGDSMSPTLNSGDRVWVNTLHVKPSPDGLYAIRDVFDQVIVKRLEVAQESPLRLRIISDNPKHTPREVSPDEVRIIGKVVGQFKLF